MGAPLTGGQVVGPAIGDLQGKITWVEKFVALGGGLPTSGSSGLASAPSGQAPPPPPQDAAAAPPPTSGPAAPAPAPSDHEGVSVTLQPTSSSSRQHPLSRVSTLSEGGGALSGGAPHSRTVSSHRPPSSTDQPVSPVVRMALHVGVLHYSPAFDVFPLLADPDG